LVRELAQRRVELRGEASVPEPDVYAEVLAATGADVDIWETTYQQRLTGSDPVLHWISATALRPVRDALPPEEYTAFCADLAPRLRAAYPARSDGTTWFPFRRIFAVARTP
jgi:trans-aconitate 2-methyltransferase